VLEKGPARIEETCDRYTAGDTDRIALNIVSRGIVGTDPAVVPRTSRTFSRNNKNGFASDLRILASRVAPVASLVTPHAPQHDVVLFKWTRKREIKNKLPSCKSVPILSRATTIACVYLMRQ